MKVDKTHIDKDGIELEMHLFTKTDIGHKLLSEDDMLLDTVREMMGIALEHISRDMSSLLERRRQDGGGFVRR